MKQEHAELIEKSLDWLESRGFSKLTSDDAVVFTSPAIRVEINYYTSSADKSVLIAIDKVGENKGFFFREYLDYIGKPRLKPNQGESDEDFIGRYLAEFRGESHGTLGNVLFGLDWIDIPRDYGSYR